MQLLETTVSSLPPDPPYATLDHDRVARTGQPEVVFGQGKTPQQVAELLQQLLRSGVSPVLATRVDAAHAAACDGFAEHDPDARVLVARRREPIDAAVRVVVVCAGTSDLPVAREVCATLSAFGHHHELVVDVGVAGIHRLFDALERLRTPNVCIVVAGMEGALPSVIAGLIAAPVLAVPTSVGYGAAFDGLAALLGMLSSCAPGVAVLNIDNGFGAALVADRILAGSPSSTRTSR